MLLKRLALCVLFILSGCAVRSIPEQVSTIATYERPPSPKKKERIVLDAGHGGRDTGSASHHHDYEEKSLTLSTTFLLQDALKQLGYDVVLTRNHDTYLPLSTRAEIANAHHADLFVSVHYNFAVSEEAHGVEVYYYKEEKQPNHTRIVESKKLAQKVLSAIIDQTKANSRGVKQANFAVVRETAMPAILIEAGFLSNKTEREHLRDPNYLRSLAKGIAAGIDKYLDESRHPSS